MAAFIEVTSREDRKITINPTHIRTVEGSATKDDPEGGPSTITFPGDDADSILQVKETRPEINLLLRVAYDLRTVGREVISLDKAKAFLAEIDKVEAGRAEWRKKVASIELAPRDPLDQIKF